MSSPAKARPEARGSLTCYEEPATDGREAQPAAEQILDLASVGLVGVANLSPPDVELAVRQDEDPLVLVVVLLAAPQRCRLLVLEPGWTRELAHQRGHRRGASQVLAVLEPADHLEEVAHLGRQLALEDGVVVGAHELVGDAHLVVLIDYFRSRRGREGVQFWVRLVRCPALARHFAPPWAWLVQLASARAERGPELAFNCFQIIQRPSSALFAAVRASTPEPNGGSSSGNFRRRRRRAKS